MSVKETVQNAIETLGAAKQILQGKKGVDRNFHHQADYTDEATAKKVFEVQKEKLLRPNLWREFSGIENTSFKHFDSKGQPVDRVLQWGDFLQLDLPGPAPYYWVKIIYVKNFANEIEIRVRPSHDPTLSPPDKKTTIHFFTREARNIFRFKRNDSQLIAEVLGRDEVINNNQPEAGNLATINTTVSATAWTTGIQTHQWNTFIKNLVEVDTQVVR